ncbi:MAG: transcriptional regulator, family [Actinomycetia bacterium]|nr:transcriptional regulator, family [Actinomycetes bacterium]
MDESTVIKTLARTVRAARKQRGWTQDQLSAHAGISKGALVAVENAATNPSLSTLCRLSDALHLPMSVLLDRTPGDGVQIIDADGVAPLWHGPDGGTAVLILVTGGPAPVELWRWRLKATEFYVNVPYPEFVVCTVTVTTGELRLIVDGVEHRVGAGATATFSATLPNSYHGAGETGCEMLATTHLPLGGRQ